MSEHMSERLTVPAVAKRLASIDETDWECAHAEEDALYLDVLSAIASGDVTGDEARDMARLAITTQEMSFGRWYA